MRLELDGAEEELPSEEMEEAEPKIKDKESRIKWLKRFWIRNLSQGNQIIEKRSSMLIEVHLETTTGVEGWIVEEVVLRLEEDQLKEEEAERGASKVIDDRFRKITSCRKKWSASKKKR